MAKIKKAMGGYSAPMKAKSGKSFPDLTGDGKVTKADILKGRGVIAKKGSNVAKKKAIKSAPSATAAPMMKKGGKAMKKQAATAIAMKKAGKAPKKMMGGGRCKNGC